MTYELLTVENFNEVFANQMGKNPSIFFYLNESNDKIESVAYFGEPIKSLIDKTEIDTEYEKLIPKLRFIAKIDWWQTYCKRFLVEQNHMNEQITIRYKNSHGETHTDNLTRAEAVELYLSLAVDLYSHVMKTPPKSGAPKETNYASH